MKNLPTLLERFSRLLNKKELAKESVAAVIKEKTGVSIAPENVSLKDTTLEITASPAVKSEIMFKSELILSELKESRGIHLSKILYK